MCRFEIPQSIVTDNEQQFDSRVYRNFCSKLKIKNLFSTLRYLQSNDQEEASNKTLLSALKKCLNLAKGKWVEKLPGVLWAYRTTSQKPTGESQFALTYEMEAIIPTVIGIPTIRTEVPEGANAEAITKDLDTTDELQEATAVRIASYQQRLANLHYRRVKLHTFKAGELILIRSSKTRPTQQTGNSRPTGKDHTRWFE